MCMIPHVKHQMVITTAIRRVGQPGKNQMLNIPSGMRAGERLSHEISPLN